jgi:hypothetical protein
MSIGPNNALHTDSEPAFKSESADHGRGAGDGQSLGAMRDSDKYRRHRTVCRIVGVLFFVDAFHPLISGVVYLCHPNWTIHVNGEDRPDAIFKVLLSAMGLAFLSLGAFLAFSPRRWLDAMWAWAERRAHEYKSKMEPGD